jgi:amino acid permease
MGIIVTIVISLLSCYTLWLIVKVSDRLKKYSFKELAEEAMGPRFGKYAGPVFEVLLTLKKFFVFFICFGSATVYFIVMGSLLPKLFAVWIGKGHWISQENNFIIICVILVFPLAMLRRITFLSYTSFFSVLSVFYMVIVVNYHFKKGYRTFYHRSG